MIMAADRVIEVGEEWWIYYSGADHFHDATPTPKAIGVARVRKEGFAALRAGNEQSYVVTRPFRWPGGQLYVNANASAGSVRVRVADPGRRLIPGFDYQSSNAFSDDAVRHPVSWNGASIADLEGEMIRLEFEFERADLFAFEAR